tara:strand:+ start:408 stop:926 length:519 start_codon:yes stop_codon:yes gene_type:complete
MIEKKKFNLYDIFKSFIVLILLIKTNTLEELLGCSIRKITKYNITKYIILFVTIWITIDVNTDDDITALDNFMNAIYLIIIFIIYSRMNIYFTIIIFLLLLLVFVLNGEETYYKLNKKKEKYKTINNIKTYTEYSIIIISIIGFIQYIYKQSKTQKSFSLNKFLFSIKCNNL